MVAWIRGWCSSAHAHLSTFATLVFVPILPVVRSQVHFARRSLASRSCPNDVSHCGTACCLTVLASPTSDTTLFALVVSVMCRPSFHLHRCAITPTLCIPHAGTPGASVLYSGACSTLCRRTFQVSGDIRRHQSGNFGQDVRQLLWGVQVHRMVCLSSR